MIAIQYVRHIFFYLLDGNVNDTPDLAYQGYTENTAMNLHRNAHLPFTVPVEEQSLPQPTSFRASADTTFSRAISRPYSTDASESHSGSEQQQFAPPSKPFSSNLASTWSYSIDAIPNLQTQGVNDMQAITGSLSSLDTFPPPPPTPLAPVYRLSSNIPSTSLSNSGTRLDDNASPPLLYENTPQDFYSIFLHFNIIYK